MGRDEVGCWKTQHRAGSSQEKQKLLDEIEELSLRLSEEQENKRRLGDRLSQERHQFQRDKEATQEVSLAVAAASYRLCTLWEEGSLTPSTGSLSPRLPPLPTWASAHLPSSAAHRGPTQAAGAPAAVQAGGRAAPGPEQQLGAATLQQPYQGE